MMGVRGKNFVGGMMVGAGAVYSLRRARRQAQGRLPRYGARLGDIPGLDAATLALPTRRSRSLSLALRLMGGALAFYGMRRRGRLGAVARAVGVALLGRRRRGRRASGRMAESLHDRRRIFDIQKTIYIEAPIDQVYAFWSSYENFPLFMSNVREVEDLGEGRSFWRVRGPGGAPIQWKARLTEHIPNQVLAWRSEPGAMLENAGIVRFQQNGTGTQLDLRLCYRPPIGGAGRAVAELLGADPRGKLNEDLGRLKSLLEATVQNDSAGAF